MKIKTILKSIIILVLSIFGCAKNEKYQFADNYLELRKQAFSASPKDLQLTEDRIGKIYGIIMETGYPEAIFSLIAFAEGSVSLYFSNGGGIIGIGQHEKPRKIALEYINQANDFLKYASETKEFLHPNNKETIFYFLTFDGIFYYKYIENNFGNNKNDLSELFHKAHELISEARNIEEKK
jgi:hypothetical protein